LHIDFSWPAAGCFAAGTAKLGLAREARKALSVGAPCGGPCGGPAANRAGDMRKPRAAKARETPKTIFFMTNLLSRTKLLSRKPPRDAEYSIWLITDITIDGWRLTEEGDSKKETQPVPIGPAATGRLSASNLGRP
jgi:hypothetical protein